MQKLGPAPTLKVQGATIAITAKDSKTLHKSKQDYMLDTATHVSFTIAGVTASVHAAQPDACKAYTLLWSLRTLAKKEVAKGETKADSVTAVTTNQLQDGGEYQVCVQARSDVRQQVLSATVCSGTITVDRSPPSTGRVGFYDSDKCGSELSYLVSADSVHVCWSGFEDRQSGVKHFVVTLTEQTTSKVVETITVHARPKNASLTSNPEPESDPDADPDP